MVVGRARVGAADAADLSGPLILYRKPTFWNGKDFPASIQMNSLKRFGSPLTAVVNKLVFGLEMSPGAIVL